tara:strand:- start:267 stop:1859 length:1593 start_codon:yes stop_codon:yes gene_type:complete
MAKIVRNPSQGEQPKKRTTADIWKSIGSALLQGLTFGTSDELVSFARSLGSDKSYTELVTEARERLDEFRKTDPVKAYSAEIIGSLPTALAGGAIIGGFLRGAQPIQKAMTAGGVEGALYGAGASDTPTIGERATSAAISAPLGAAGGAIGQKITPVLQEGAKSMLKRGFPLTMGQAYGEPLSSIEQKISSPLMQPVIQAARAKPQQKFVTETINNAIAPIKVKLPFGVTGEEAVDKAMDAIADAYEEILPKAKLNVQPVNTKIDSIIGKAILSVDEGGVSLTPEDVKDFRKIINEVYGRFARGVDFETGAISGERFKESEALMSKAIRNLKNQGKLTETRLLREVQSSLRDEFAKQNPDLPDLQAVNKAYRNMMPIVKISDAAVSRQGVFTPSRLVKEEQKGRGRRAEEVVRAREARDILGSTVGDSGTAGRLMTSPMKTLASLPSYPLLSSMYEFPSFGRNVAKLPALATKATTPFLAANAPSLLPNSLLSDAQAAPMDREEMMMNLLGEQTPMITIRPQGSQYLLTD